MSADQKRKRNRQGNTKNSPSQEAEALYCTCLSFAGFQSGSKSTNRFPPIRLRPQPPALLLRRNANSFCKNHEVIRFLKPTFVARQLNYKLFRVKTTVAYCCGIIESLNKFLSFADGSCSIKANIWVTLFLTDLGK